MKKSLFFVVGIGAMLILISSFSAADELSFCGLNFSHSHSDWDHDKDLQGYVFQDDAYGWMSTPVYFPNSASGMNVTRLSVTYYDNSAAYYVRLRLYKTDRWSGASTLVGELNSTGDSTSVRYMNMPQSQLSARGIDNNRYAWYLYCFMNAPSGEGRELRLHQVTIRYE